MTGLLSSLTLYRLFMTAARLAGLLLVALALLRLAVWISGRENLHADVVVGPQMVEWHEDDPAFGGLSALLMDPDGLGLVAGGDRGILVAARLRRDEAGRIEAFEGARLTPVSLASGLAPTSFKMDLEGLARTPDGGLMTAFEGFVRIERLARSGDRPVATHPWDRFVGLFGNQAFEALASLPDGRVIAIAETTGGGSLAPSTIHDGTAWRDGPGIPVGAGFAITGADVGLDGCLYLTERRYGITSGFSFRLRRLSTGPEGWRDTVLQAGAPAQLGNVEGVATWRDEAGRIVIDLITDNGFLPFTPTRLIELRARPGTDCMLDF
jgi:hypothetical protein